MVAGLVWLLKRFPVLNEDFWKNSLSLEWVNISPPPNKGRLQKRCQRKPALHHSGWSARHQEGHAGSQASQWGKGVVKMHLVPSGPCQQVIHSTPAWNALPILVFFDSGGVQSQAPEGGQPWVEYAWSSGHWNGQEGRQAEQPGNADGQEAALIWEDLNKTLQEEEIPRGKCNISKRRDTVSSIAQQSFEKLYHHKSLLRTFFLVSPYHL